MHPLSRIALACLPSIASARLAPAATPAAATTPFAQPASSTSVATPGLGSLAQVAASLALVLALVFLLAWLLRRLRTGRRAGGPGIDVLADLPLGPKERAVLIQVDQVRLLVGVAAGQVRTLHVLPEAEPVASEAAAAGASPVSAPPSFAELLRRSLGK